MTRQHHGFSPCEMPSHPMFNFGISAVQYSFGQSSLLLVSSLWCPTKTTSLQSIARKAVKARIPFTARYGWFLGTAWDSETPWLQIATIFTISLYIRALITHSKSVSGDAKTIPSDHTVSILVCAKILASTYRLHQSQVCCYLGRCSRLSYIRNAVVILLQFVFITLGPNSEISI